MTKSASKGSKRQTGIRIKPSLTQGFLMGLSGAGMIFMPRDRRWQTHMKQVSPISVAKAWKSVGNYIRVAAETERRNGEARG